MEYRHLGKTGIRVSELSFGSWVAFHMQADINAAAEMMSAAYEAGVNFFDNAEAYARGKSERHHLHKPVTEQPRYNLFERQRFSKEYERVYKDYGYGATTFSPLANGLLSGKYNKGIPGDSRAALEGYDWMHDAVTDQGKLAKVQALEPIAQESGCTLSQLALAWCLKNPFVSTVITGASRVEQVHENMKAIEVLPKLTAEVLERIDTIFEVKKEEEEE